VYCHEILQVKSLEELYANVVPDIPTQSKAISDEIQKVDFAKYCLKMATGTGKTWVLLALHVWQYFNAQNNERPHSTVGESKDWYSDRFLVVAPGREVLDRLLDAFKGRRDPNTGLRNLSMADYNIPLMMPESWRIKFNPQKISRFVCLFGSKRIVFLFILGVNPYLRCYAVVIFHYRFYVTPFKVVKCT
jgi:type III restriction enzyme